MTKRQYVQHSTPILVPQPRPSVKPVQRRRKTTAIRQHNSFVSQQLISYDISSVGEHLCQQQESTDPGLLRITLPHRSRLDWQVAVSNAMRGTLLG